GLFGRLIRSRATCGCPKSSPDQDADGSEEGTKKAANNAATSRAANRSLADGPVLLRKVFVLAIKRDSVLFGPAHVVERLANSKNILAWTDSSIARRLSLERFGGY